MLFHNHLSLSKHPLLSVFSWKNPNQKTKLLKFHISNCLATSQTVLAHPLKILSLFRTVYLHLTLLWELLVLPLERICVSINSGISCSHYALKCASSYSFYFLGIFGRHIWTSILSFVFPNHSFIIFITFLCYIWVIYFDLFCLLIIF